MAVVGTARQISSALHVDAELHRTYTSVYEVLTDSVSDGPLTAQACSGIPTIGDSYSWGSETDLWAFADDGDCQLREVDKTRKLWRITVRHSTRPRYRSTGSDAVTARGNPLSEPPTIYGSFVTFTRPEDRDKDARAITNSVDELKLIDIDDNRHLIAIEVNTATISLAQWKQYRVSVNSTPIWGLDARQVKLKEWNWRILYYGTTNWYISHHYEFEISEEPHPKGKPAFPNDVTYGWNHHFLDMGFRHKNPAWTTTLNPDSYWHTNKDAHDQVIHQELPLDGDGNLATPGASPVWRVYAVYRELDFRLLPGIPNPLPGPFV